jgi:WD40 repeat protein
MSFKDFFKDENAITDVFIHNENGYFVTSTNLGLIIVWKMSTSKKLLHTFKGHFKEVTSLMPNSKNSSLFYSSSLDCTIKIWSIDKFQMLYSFDCSNSIQFISIFRNGGDKVVSSSKGRVTLFSINFMAENYLSPD